MLSHKYALNILRDQLKELEEQKAKYCYSNQVETAIESLKETITFLELDRIKLNFL
jgi:hypothetical protein